MSEDFAGNSFETGGNLNLTPSLHTFGDSGGPLDTREQYSLTPGGSSSFNLSLDEKSVNADVEELNSTSEILPTSALLGINGQSLYKTADATAPNQEATLPQNWDSLTAFGEPMFETGVFTVGPKGEVGVDFLLDGGKYQGELAIFSLKGIDQFELGSEDFIQEAARRALTNSDLGYVVINDLTEGARFHGSFAWEGDSNSGEYQGVKTFLMRPGDQFGVMLVPNGTVQQVFDNPAVDGAIRPLFSLATANPNDAFHVGQIADVTGEGNTFVMEDLRVDGWIDKDYNDIIFQVRGATARAVQLDEVIKPAYDWRGSDLGQALIAYAKPYVTLPEPIQSDPIVSPPINSDVTSAKPIDAVPIVSPPLDTNPVVTPPVNSDVTSAKPIDAVPIVSPPLETNPVVTAPVDSKSVSFDFPASNQPLVGVIDTGFSGNNPDIDYSRIILGRDRISNDDNPLLQPGEGNEHGTHVLGIIGATQNNGIGIDGVNDKAPIWVGRAVGAGQWAESLVDFVNAARDSNQPNAVVNLSMDLTQVNPDGSVTTRYELTPQERAAIEYARQYNVLIVAAAGNDGGVMSVLGQASQEFDNIITVGSAQDFDPSIAPAEGFNRTDYSSYGYGLDIMANGGTTEQPVLSTVGDGVGTMAGTSVATAEVTGAVSQVWAANPQLSYRQVIEIIKSTATDLDTPNWDAITAAGLLNLAAAVLLAKVTTPEEYDAPATVIPATWSGEGKVTPSERAAAVPMWPTVEPTSFTGRVMATAGANVRSGPGTSYSIVGSRGYNSSATFDGWTYGERITDIALGTPDERWYRIAGTTNQWIASAIIDGNAPGSTPLPPDNSGGGTPLPQPQPSVPINGDSPNYRNGSLNPFAQNPYLIGQCTWYAYGRMLETGLLPPGAKANGWFLGNAEAWRRDAARAGLPVSSTPTPGARSLVVWPPGVQGGHRQYGHVAFVEEVYPDGRIRISESNWAGQSIGERTLTPAQYSGLSFVRLENATPSPSFSSPPARSGQQREYRVRLGDTLSGIAYRELGDANRWREITKADSSTFTEAEVRQLQVGMSVYLPVTYSSGTGIAITPPPSSTPNQIEFVDPTTVSLSQSDDDLSRGISKTNELDFRQVGEPGSAWRPPDFGANFGEWSDWLDIPIIGSIIEGIAQRAEDTLWHFFENVYRPVSNWPFEEKVNLSTANKHLRHFLVQTQNPGEVISDISVDKMLENLDLLKKIYHQREERIIQIIEETWREISSKNKLMKPGSYWIKPKVDEKEDNKGFSRGIDLINYLNMDGVLSGNEKDISLLDFYCVLGNFQFNTQANLIVSDDGRSITVELKALVHDYFNFDMKLFETLDSLNTLDWRGALAGIGRFSQSFVQEFLVQLGMANNYRQWGESSAKIYQGTLNLNGNIDWS
jgi:surface antigen/subtilisin family serine protease